MTETQLVLIIATIYISRAIPKTYCLFAGSFLLAAVVTHNLLKLGGTS